MLILVQGVCPWTVQQGSAPQNLGTVAQPSDRGSRRMNTLQISQKMVESRTSVLLCGE